MNKNFCMIGVAGFIAPKHLKAIYDTGNFLTSAYDISDSVGVLDSYFPDTAFFTEFERFDRHIDKIQRSDNRIDYTTICSPNYLHESHIRFGLKSGMHVIVEKPVVLNPANAESLLLLEKECGKSVSTILQLRLHPAILKLKQEIDAADKSKIFDFDLTYITSRGNWYYASWKADITKSGGIITNIGIHLFDMLIWLFGDVKMSTLHINSHDRASGFLEFARANVRWFLSINKDTLPKEVAEKGGRAYRSMALDGKQIEFSDGFTDLHTKSYQNILNGSGFGIQQALPSIRLTHLIRNQIPVGVTESYHPFALKQSSFHPFYTAQNPKS